MFSIGEFSRVTGMTVKTLRFYHEQQLLLPTLIDPQSGYRYYDASLIERARAIVFLRTLELGLDQIGEILASADDPGAVLEALSKHRQTLNDRIRHLRGAVRSLDQFLAETKPGAAMAQTTYQVEEKAIEPMLMAGVRMKGRYADCGKGFSRIGRALGRFISGPCFLLHYDTEYKEEDADFEACMALRVGAAGKTADGISVRQLPTARCVCLVHKGPYDQLGPSYQKAITYAKQKGNPKNYLTEIQLPVG
jgi:DNA-binding transcriptional MerR regulator